ncbi:nucleotidyltransferase domain-containing protein [Billgrantia ethanolica]|nr:nucleotidyltransferase domain-containing protein [Halomonas ethanolica]
MDTVTVKTGSPASVISRNDARLIMPLMEHTAMRLTHEQVHIILTTVHDIVGGDVEVRLFGSRLDDNRKGGDLDLLLISSTPLPRLSLAEIKCKLEERLYLPVDILAYSRDKQPSPFQAIALNQGCPLKEAA